MKIHYILFTVFLLSHISLPDSITLAQAENEPCSSPEASQLDFWVGSWKLDWVNIEGKTEYGTNTVSKILGGCVIEENFSTADNSFKGKSISLYNPRKKHWQQTWVDNSGAYLDFTGGLEDGKMIFTRKAVTKESKEILQRMVWYDITENEFYWNWESSADNGASWKTLWKIHYTRNK